MLERRGLCSGSDCMQSRHISSTFNTRLPKRDEFRGLGVDGVAEHPPNDASKLKDVLYSVFRVPNP